MKWWGWGDPDRREQIAPEALGALRAELGAEPRDFPVTPLEEMRLEEPRLSRKARERIADVVGEQWVREDRLTRVTHAAGKSYPDLIRMRTGAAETAPDAIVYPANRAEVKALLDRCAADRIAVVPFGGGTSVVGGVEPLRNGFDSVVSLDMGRIASLDEVDRRSLTATLGSGKRLTLIHNSETTRP
jgi:alkyldihydroxyacetonephosphate synthase